MLVMMMMMMMVVLVMMMMVLMIMMMVLVMMCSLNCSASRSQPPFLPRCSRYPFSLRPSLPAFPLSKQLTPPIHPNRTVYRARTSHLSLPRSQSIGYQTLTAAQAVFTSITR
ncbi:hypothetical protein ElyMa_006424200 [Elysia marginata]|uniref:Secreted protein n=1 Tax=Elysia marginata TaxID=1093978 RepID=A0AAV4HXN6_9GAST|nr:hypothetical protein ElyMa_006424200 [Elysia marginata]